MFLQKTNFVFSNRTFELIFQFVFFIICISVVFYNSFAMANTCKSVNNEDNTKNTFCFFSLNSPKEFETLEEQYGDIPGVEIREFYGVEGSGKSVKERYKEMLKTQECDQIIYSGHHPGYYTGDQALKGKNPDWKLDLDFMEDLSCEEGCADWFSNVKGVFLMGCQTVKTERELQKGKTADSEHIRVSKDYDIKTNYGHHLVNQAYSSTLSDNDMLSHRYLRMHPNSSLYGWGGKAPTEIKGSLHSSENSLPKFINWASNLVKRESNSTDPNSILDFISYMNNPAPVCRDRVSTAWTKHWTENPKGRLATACYLEEDREFKENFIKYHKQGCDLRNALKADDSSKIKGSIREILKEPESIKANFNRLMSLIISGEYINKPWYNDVIEQLKKDRNLRNTLVGELKSNKTGFVRKSDYLYFYKEMGWADSEDSIEEIRDVSTTFLNQLQSTFDEAEKSSGDKTVYQSLHLSILNSIEYNDLQGWLHQKNPDEFENFVKHVEKRYPPPKNEEEEKKYSGIEWYINQSFKYVRGPLLN